MKPVKIQPDDPPLLRSITAVKDRRIYKQMIINDETVDICKDIDEADLFYEMFKVKRKRGRPAARKSLINI